METLVVFTDLDGTLLDEYYSFAAALPALALIGQHKIPLVICSSKTRSEIELYRKRLNNDHPFISENGGGIFIPRGYFGPNSAVPEGQGRRAAYHMIRLGTEYACLRKVLKDLQADGYAVKGFGDMSAEEVAHVTGLPLEEAALAKERGFDEPFFYTGGEKEIAGLFKAIKKKGFGFSKGRVYHLLGQSDKGKAVSMLIDLYRRTYGAVTVVGLGDDPNDRPMLEVVDVPVVVQDSGGIYNPSLLTISGVIRAEGIGPEGWNRVMMKLLQTMLPEKRQKNIDKGKKGS